MNRILGAVNAGLNAVFIGLIRVYQYTLSPMLGQRCKYYPSCSNYAIGALREHGPIRGLGLASWRLLRCNPVQQRRLRPRAAPAPRLRARPCPRECERTCITSPSSRSSSCCCTGSSSRSTTSWPALGLSYSWTWGLAIIGLTIIVRLILFPLTWKQYKSAQQMQMIQPQIKELQKKYKSDRGKLQEETMKLYSEHRVNPFASCLPLILQLPVFISLYAAIKGLGPL